MTGVSDFIDLVDRIAYAEALTTAAGRDMPPTRQLILVLLAHKADRTTGELSVVTGLSSTCVRDHLAILKSHRLVECVQVGAFRRWRLVLPEVSA